MGATRFGRVLEKDRAAARSLKSILPGKAAFLVAGTWTDTIDGTNNSVFSALTSGTANLNPGFVFSIHAGMLVSAETADAVKGEVTRGPRINSIELAYAITGNALDAHAATLDTIVYTDDAAPTVTNRPITGTLATAVTTDPDNPRVTTLTVTTPFVLSGDLIAQLRVQVDQAAGGSAYRLYYACVNFDLLL